MAWGEEDIARGAVKSADFVSCPPVQILSGQVADGIYDASAVGRIAFAGGQMPEGDFSCQTQGCYGGSGCSYGVVRIGGKGGSSQGRALAACAGNPAHFRPSIAYDIALAAIGYQVQRSGNGHKGV